MLEIVREKMSERLMQIEDEVVGGWRRGEEEGLLGERRGMERMMVECDLLLSDCYSTMSKQFYSLHGYINERCIFDRMKDDP